MSDELEARMWDEERSPMFDPPSQGAFYESAFASSEHLDRAPLLDDTYTDVPVPSAPLPAETEHCHWRARDEPEGTAGQLVAAIVLCGIFMVCELIGGYMAGSLSVMSDAAHMLSDCGSFAIALVALKCAKRPPDSTMTYGYKRIEVLGALISVLIIWLLTAIFVYVSCVRLYTGDYDVSANAMMAVSGCGVAFNIVLAAVLHGCNTSIAHHHTHGGSACAHSHSHSNSNSNSTFNIFRRRGDKSNGALVNGDYSMRDASCVEASVHTSASASNSNHRNINIRAAFIHAIGDLIQSCGVLLASIIIKIYPSAMYVDPLCTFVFGGLVGITTARLLRDLVRALAMARPADLPYESLVSALRSIQGVRHVHSVHAWSLSTHHTVLTAHLAIDEVTDPDTVLRSCQNLARTTFRVENATFQIERYTSDMARCEVCRHNSR